MGSESHDVDVPAAVAAIKPYPYRCWYLVVLVELTVLIALEVLVLEQARNYRLHHDIKPETI